MYDRMLKFESNSSYFLFGPRGTGKTTWIRRNFKNAVYIDLLDSRYFNQLIGNSQRLNTFIPPDFKDWIIIDEVQKIPSLLDEVHRLIESKNYKFILTGSSSRKLKNKGVNLLAGRAITKNMYPLTSLELGADFNLISAIKYGTLPQVINSENKGEYLASYVQTYLKEEVQQEGLTRNLGAFARFLESASFSQGSVLNITSIASDCGVERRVVHNYFSILEDLLIAYFLPVFKKRAKRRMIQHPKFYFFDAGIFSSIRPMGPLDITQEIGGVALRTLVLQELKALNSYLNLGYDIYYWRTSKGEEVDFILYGEQDFLAIEVKHKAKLNKKDTSSIRKFQSDYPEAKCYILYSGDLKMYEDSISIVPLHEFFKNIVDYLK